MTSDDFEVRSQSLRRQKQTTVKWTRSLTDGQQYSAKEHFREEKKKKKWKKEKRDGRWMVEWERKREGERVEGRWKKVNKKKKTEGWVTPSVVRCEGLTSSPGRGHVGPGDGSGRGCAAHRGRRRKKTRRAGPGCARGGWSFCLLCSVARAHSHSGRRSHTHDPFFLFFFDKRARVKIRRPIVVRAHQIRWVAILAIAHSWAVGPPFGKKTLRLSSFYPSLFLSRDVATFQVVFWVYKSSDRWHWVKKIFCLCFLIFVYRNFVYFYFFLCYIFVALF